MSAADTMRTIKTRQGDHGPRLHLVWSDGAEADIDLGQWLQRPAFAALRDPSEFARVEIGDWGHSLSWPSGEEAGADALWLETLSATRREGVRTFLDWPAARASSLIGAAEALGLVTPDGGLLLERGETSTEDGAAGVQGLDAAHRR